MHLKRSIKHPIREFVDMVLTPGSSGVGNLGGKEPTKSPNWPKELEKGLSRRPPVARS